jgi:hypothetical protein
MANVSITGDSIDITIRLFTGDAMSIDFDSFGDNGEKYIEIPVDCWMNIRFVQDMFEVFPKIEIGVVDRGFINIVQTFGNGDNFVQVVIHSANEDIELREAFIIDDVKLINTTLESANLLICGTSVKSLWFQQIVKYSTGFDHEPNPIPITRIITEILDEAKIDFYRMDCEETAAKLEYITPGNYNVYDCLNYLFKKILADDPTDGVFCIPYNMVEKQLMLTQISLKAADYANRLYSHNNLTFPTKSATPSARQLLVYDQTSKGYLQGSRLAYDMSADNTIIKFDHLTRTWTKDVRTIDDFISRLPPPISYKQATDEPIIKLPTAYVQSLELNYKYETYSRNCMEYANLVQNMFRLTDSLNFQCVGHMSRTPGDLINIVVSDSKAMLDSRYGGVWVASRVYSSFSKTDFIQELTVVRTNKKQFVEKYKVESL